MLSKYWNSISSYIQSNGHTLFDLGFRQGASQKEICELEKSINCILPDDYKEFLTITNGQKFHQYDCFFHFLPTNMRFLGTDEILETWGYQQKFVTPENIQEFWNFFQQNDSIRSVIFHPKRIPVAEYEGEANIWLDFIPAPNGQSGQLISNYTECDMLVLNQTITQLLSNYVQLLNTGILKFGGKQKVNGEGYSLYSQTEKYCEVEDIIALYKKYCIIF